MRKPDLRIRSTLSWLKAAAWAIPATVLVFALFNWQWCWFFRYGWSGMVFWVYVFAWIVAFFAVRPLWRILLLLGTLLVGFPMVGTRYGVVEENAAAESAAVEALHQIGDGLRSSRQGQPGQAYPDTMPSVPLSSTAKKFYHFQYRPVRSPDGHVTAFLIWATPARRECGFHRSFTMTDGGQIFWALEPRPATTADHRLAE